ADFEIDVARHELRRGGAIVRIEPQVFGVLVPLIRNRDRIVSRNELVDAIWQGRIVSEATLSSPIRAARPALGDSGNAQSITRTLRKRGFRFVGDVDGDSSAPAVIGTEKGISPQDAAHDAAKHMATHQLLPLTGEPSTAVPSFDNMARGSDQECFAHSLAT